MRLQVLLPIGVFADEGDVLRIVAVTREGSFGILPNRLDCVAPLAPGILTYEAKEKGEVYVAVDEGVLVKTDQDVLVSVRRAIGGKDLGALRDSVENEFRAVDDQEQRARQAMAKLEAGVLRRLASMQNE